VRKVDTGIPCADEGECDDDKRREERCFELIRFESLK
jgi:hypothetical protein